MGYGGATWETAGDLDFGGSNTFDRADATETDANVAHQAWWTFTPTVRGRVTFDTFGSTPSSADLTADIYSSDEFPLPPGSPEWEFDDEGGPGVDWLPAGSFDVRAGVTYHFVVPCYDEFEDLGDTYSLTATLTPYTATSWNSSHRDRDGNEVIISPGWDGYGELQAPYDTTPSWFAQVIQGGTGREGTYAATEAFGIGADPVSGAADCVWEHAMHGDRGSQFWNGSGSVFDDVSGGLCVPLGVGTVDGLNGPGSHEWSAVDTGGIELDTAHATVHLGSRQLFVRPVRDNVGPEGFLEVEADPIEDGVPLEFADEAVLEWETEYVDLVAVHLTGDAPDRSVPDFTDGSVWALRDDIQPTWVEDDVLSAFEKGAPGIHNGYRDQRIEFGYVNGDVLTWTEVTGLVTGADGWDDVKTELPGPPDEVIIFGTAVGMGVVPPTLEDTYAPNYDVAVRITVRSPRYRWVYLGPPVAVASVAPRRIFGRSDGLTHGAARPLGGGNTVQSGPRTLGGIL
jgi:hypothetical protein